MKDEYHGQGGKYEVRDGKRVLVERTGWVKQDKDNGTKVQKETATRKD
jgi:hypothetical protein